MDGQDMLRLVHPVYPVHPCSVSRRFANAEWHRIEDKRTHSSLEFRCVATANYSPPGTISNRILEIHFGPSESFSPQSETMQKNPIWMVVTVLLVFFGALVFWGSAIRESSAAQDSELAASRWEYTMFEGNGTGSISPLNDLGKDGWELVSTVCDTSTGGNGSVRHYLKRKLP
jgi:hypothetical protein